MIEQGIDLLVMQNDNQFLGGYVRYFLDVPAEQAYPITVLFPAGEEMTVISCGAPSGSLPPDYALRGVKAKIGRPYFRSVSYTNQLDAEVAVKTIRDLKCKKVGFVGFSMLSAMFYKYLTENLAEVEFVDATDMVDRIKAIKSEEEIAWIRKAVAMHDYVVAAIPALLRPGMYEFELRAELQKIMVEYGSEEQLIMMGSEVTGKRTPQLHSFLQNRRIEKGDQVFVMVEASGPAGFYAEIGRIFSLDDPPRPLLEAWEIARSAQHYVASLLKPGAEPARLLEANNSFLEGKGFAGEERLFAHGQGYDLVERPAFLPQETMKLEENMLVAVHPVAANDSVFAFCCDNYLVTAEGAELLQKTPQEIFVL